jgi:AAA domain
VQDNKPTTHQRDLAKLPRALAPLIERPKWCVWRWTFQKNGRWQKPPYRARNPQHHASTRDSSTWCDYATALAAVQAGHADGISYVLTEADPFAAIDLDHCRHADTHSIDVWAQNFLDVARHTYAEVTPSGEGCRIWGLTGDNSVSINRKFTLEIDGKPVAVELFRRTPKALTVTGLRLAAVRELTILDKAFDWAIVWGERRKAAAAEAAATKQQINCHGFNGGSGHDIDDVERVVREGVPDGANRSDAFHGVVGHYLGCGWSIEQIDEHLRQFPDGIGGRYLGECRLSREIARSAGKYQARSLPLVDGWKAPDAVVEAPAPKTPDPGDDELDEPASPAEDDELDELPVPPRPETPDPGDDPGLGKAPAQDPGVGLDKPVSPDTPDPVDNPELEDDDPELEDDVEESQPDSKLPRMYSHGDPNPDAAKTWLIKHLMSTVGHGLLSGQWGTGKTFVVFDLAVSLGTGQPFLGHAVKRQCGVLLIAAEGAGEVELRLGAVVRHKCGGTERIPFRWYKEAPLLLQKGAVETLIAMARQAEASLQAEFGLPLGLVVIDTIAACAGYPKAGDENDSAAAQAVMNTLKAVAETLGCFVLGVDHFGKNAESGTRGSGAKESAADLVLACLGDKELNGSVTNTRLAVRKHRGGRQGQEHPFTLRVAEAPEPDEDGEAVTTMIVDWLPAGASGGHRPGPDPWAAGRTQDQRTAVLRLKRVLMGALAEHGVEREIPPDGPAAWMIDREVVRGLFYVQTPADGTPAQKTEYRRKQFNRALAWAEAQELITGHEIDGVVYLRLCSLKAGDDNEEE